MPEVQGLPTIDQASNIFGNTAGGEGGGVYVEAADLTMSGGELHGNTAAGYGGGIYVDAANKTVTMTNVKVAENQAGGKGGGAYIWNGTLDGSLAELTDNTATGGIVGIGFKKNQATAPLTVPANQQTKVEDP